MELQELAIADGKVESVQTSMEFAEVIFVDWQEGRWCLRFSDVLAVEDLNIEGEELDRVEVDVENDYLVRIREVVDEPHAPVACYTFFTPWKDQPRLRVVAANCHVSKVTDD